MEGGVLGGGGGSTGVAGVGDSKRDASTVTPAGKPSLRLRKSCTCHRYKPTMQCLSPLVKLMCFAQEQSSAASACTREER